jgi:hypothetical protein
LDGVPRLPCGHGVLAQVIAREAAASVVEPNPNRLRRETAGYEQVKIVIIVDIDRFNPQVKQIPKEDVERLRLRGGAEIEIDPIGITFRRLAGAYPGSDVRNLIAVEIRYSRRPRPQQVHSRKTMLCIGCRCRTGKPTNRDQQ